MSWGAGSTIFLEVWPILEKNIRIKKDLYVFSEELILLFQSYDMDIDDLLGSSNSLDKFLKKTYGLTYDNDCFIGHDDENSLLMKISKELAKKLHMELSLDEDHVCLSSALPDKISTLNINLYNYANREYSFDISVYSVLLSDDGSSSKISQKIKNISVSADYDYENKKYIKDLLTLDNLVKSVMDGVSAILNNDYDKENIIG